MTKTWLEKFNNGKPPQVKTINKPWLGRPAGSKMLISSPQEIADYISNIPVGKFANIGQMRDELARKHMADFTCPLTTGIFLRIVAEKSYEEISSTQNKVVPFWRAIEPDSKLANKLSFGSDFISQMREKEA